MLVNLINRSRDRFYDLRIKLLEMKMQAFAPKVLFNWRHNDYCIKTVDSLPELKSVLELRHKIFFQEALGESRASYDFDRYDLLADHVILKHLPSNKIVGTYRLLSSEFTDEFYSEREFELTNFKKCEGRKLELGRACVSRDFRSGVAISLIWQGIAKYAQITESDYFFGCGSVRSTDPHLAVALTDYFNEVAPGRRFDVKPTIAYEFDFLPDQNSFSVGEVANYVPPLLRSYINAGARVHGMPAIDRAMQCTDFMVILDLKQLTPKFRIRYF